MNGLFDVIPNQATLSEPLFDSDEKYQAFRQEFAEQIAPEFDLLRDARRQSEEEAKQIWMR